MLIDLHSHTTISDGSRSVERMVLSAERCGYEAFAITDHARGDDPGYRDVVAAVMEAVGRVQRDTPIRLFAGVELTEFEPHQIADAAREVRRCGAQVVVVHGECVSMSVLPGTNAAAVRSPAIDVLGHPGLISYEDAQEAAAHGVYLEVSARAGHNWANGHVFKNAVAAGACLIVDSDAHDEGGLLSESTVHALLRGAGASETEVQKVVGPMATGIMHRLSRRLVAV